MLIKNLTVTGLLSFGPEGISLPMRDLNVFIGPNGSGKSNLFEVLGLLQASPNNLSAPTREIGIAREWLWKGAFESPAALIQAEVASKSTNEAIFHKLYFGEGPEGFSVGIEEIADSGSNSRPPLQYYSYDFRSDRASLTSGTGDVDELPFANLVRTESILSQLRDPRGQYPALAELQTAYGSMRLYRNWEFGPTASVRRKQPTDLRSDYLSEDCDNLALIVSKMIGGTKRDLIKNLQELIDGVEGIDTPVQDSSIRVFLYEGNGISTPSNRMSDGTLRYLCLLAILLHPKPPRLIAIEEPELGLHPDILPHLGKLVKEASSRMQILITTHSQVLLDSFSSEPEDVVVCSRGPSGSVFQRLDREKLDFWLKEHTLGELWNLGEIGGTRW